MSTPIPVKITPLRQTLLYPEDALAVTCPVCGPTHVVEVVQRGANLACGCTWMKSTYGTTGDGHRTAVGWHRNQDVTMVKRKGRE